MNVRGARKIISLEQGQDEEFDGGTREKACKRRRTGVKGRNGIEVICVAHSPRSGEAAFEGKGSVCREAAA